MKQKTLVLSLLGALSLYGCTLDAPLKLGVKCSDEEHGLSAVIFNRTICHPEDVTGEQKEVCGAFADAFKYGHCPLESPICIEDEAGFTCSVSNCNITHHEYRGQCEQNTLLHCGQHGYECELNVAGWADGFCQNDLTGAKCVATSCEEGYEIDASMGACTAMFNCNSDEHISNGECEKDSLEHCGKHGYACALRVAGWDNGSCEQGVCVPSSCEAGYKLEVDAETGINKCVGSVTCEASEHIYVTEDSNCEADTVSNCGHHGNSCLTLEGWSDGNCVEGRCHATACIGGYELNKETASCRIRKCDVETEHQFEDHCESNDVQNCGSHGNSCFDIPGWLDGACVYDEASRSAKCRASACEAGYDLITETFQCKARQSCENPDTHYYNGECIANDLENCGKHNSRCSDTAGWKTGECVLGKCVATECEVGYDVTVNGKCEAKLSCEDPETHYYNGECIPNDLENCGKHNNRCANLVGWKEGACVEGVCQPSACISGYHLNDSGSECVGDDNANCGSVGHRCGLGEVCSGGECKENCGSGEVRCETDDVVSCADPNSSVLYCGADEACGSFHICGAGQACVGGQCVQNSCSGDATLCVVGGENQCLMLNSDNANHCGACNLKCDEQQALNAHSNVCLEGRCQYVCNDDFTNCGSPTLPNCINNANFANDPYNCGTCGNKCLDDEYCNGGTCLKTTCVNSCLSNSECINTADKCGTQCINCNTANYAALGTCEAGACKIVQCAPGYHIDGEICAPNTATACAPVNSGDVVNCTNANYAADGYCNNEGQCVATNCTLGYHVESGICVADTERACGAAKTDCTGLAGWSNGICQDGKCLANACQAGYCLNGSTCVDGSYNSLTCGADGGSMTCIKCGDGRACANGTCVQSSCDPTVCFYQGEECDNSATHCGSACTNCNTANHASAGICNANGTCSITACAVGYHLKGVAGSYTCEANSATLCAPVDSVDVVDCNVAGDASSGICNSDGTCMITSCRADYHLVDGACVHDSNTACGAGAVNCAGLDGWDNGLCVSGVCQASSCKSGYCLNGTTCVNGSSNSLMCAVNGGSAQCVACSSDQACVNSACVTSSCKENECFYQGNTCSNENDHCGKSCTNCNTAGNASVGTCDAGVCKISKCAVGYHLSGTPGNYTCEANSATKCGPVDRVDIISCNGYNGAIKGDCNTDGQCVALSCEVGTHVFEGRCVSDSVTACGAGAVSCADAIEGWENGTCDAGQCKASSCKVGYCLNNSKCVDGSFNSLMCGASGGTTVCDSCGTGKACVSGSCVQSSCSGNECFYQGEVCSNTPDHCGSACTNCNTANNASAGTCDGGVCKITACATGYHLVNNSGAISCEANTTEKCGASDSTETVNCNTANHAATGICGADGSCMITRCEGNYHLESGVCVADSDVACGPSGVNCRELGGWQSGTCISGACVATRCATGFCLSGSTCVDGLANSLTCGTGGNACTKCGEGMACVSGSCTQSSCTSGICFYQGETCSNADDHCGTNCVNCNSADNASKGKCEAGACKIEKCALGYHLKGTAGNYICEMNDAEKCGKQDSAVTVNCKTSNHATNGVCNSNGTCTTISCEIGYHVSDGSCVPDSENACGTGATNCTTLDGWAGGKCDKGVCKAESCKPSFCLSGSTCVNGSSNALACGTTGGTCTSCGEHEACILGVCEVSSCNANECFHNAEVCQNGDTHCGTSCIDCTTVNHASNGTCNVTSGQCTIKACAVGYHLKGTAGNYSCEANKPTLCGKIDSTVTVDCTNSQHGTSGYCDSNGACVYTSCQTGYHVKDGKCVGDTINACGAALTNCEAGGWQTGSCQNGVCVASACKSGYCLSDGTCVNGSSNALACGITGGACATCDSDKACVSGSCKTTTCGANECFFEGNLCSNTAEHCGKSCLNCNTENHAASGTCTASGTCSILTCAPGYHRSGSTCVQNTAHACAKVDSETPVDCTNSNNANDGYCNDNGECVYTSCNTGSHIEGGVCVADTVTACGAARTNCKVGGWKSGACVEGVCVASACNANYCLSNGTCVDGSANSLACGISGSACLTCGSGKACVSGVCVQSSCSSNMCFFEGTTCENSNTHCGKSCTNCNTANNAAEGVCNTTTGLCTIKTCASGYHLSSDGSKCEQNTATSCGAVNSSTTKNCNRLDENTEAGYCDANGSCVVTGCKLGYHVKNGVCEKDTPAVCGAALVNCEVNGWQTGDCKNGVCVASACKSGYCLSEGACVNGNSNAMACGLTGGICKVCGSKEACVSGSCEVSECDENVCYYNGTTCQNANDHCGTSCTNCNTAGNAATGTCNTRTGKCTINTCASGYHFTSVGTCEVNKPTSCGPVNVNAILDCTTMGNANDGYCGSDGTCVATSCVAGFHVDNKKCVADKVEACGASRMDCNTLPGWKDGICKNGECQASACDAGYCLNGTTCTDGAMNSSQCGISGGTTKCKACTSGQFCQSGECKVSSCDENVCFYQGTSCSNDTTHCGSSCLNCNVEGHAASGQCVSGACKVKTCAVGYHLEGTSGNYVCKENSDENCGSTSVVNATNCRKIKNVESAYCSTSGECVVTRCNLGFHLSDDGECIEDTLEACGASPVNCVKLEGWKDGICEEGRCLAKLCAEGFCLSDNVCVKGERNALACGIKGGEEKCEVCEGNMACISGQCRITGCTGNACFYQGACYNDASHCGTSCINCNTSNNAASGTCNSGVCKATKCATGYHPVSGDCIVNSPTACAPVTGGTPVNCNNMNTYTSAGYCNNGSCMATSCKVGAHIESGVCVEDKPEACGAALVNCTKLPGWKDGKCEAGACVANNCLSGYCLRDQACVEGSANAMACGIDGGTKGCEICSENYYCADGKCNKLDTGCGANVCYYQGTTCENANTHCGKSCIDCTSANHASAGSCNTSTGKCTISNCALGYHLNGSGGCVANSNEACAHTDSSTTANCMSDNNASYGICDVNGDCIIVSCASGYHYYKGNCEPNDDKNCGAYGNACDTANHFACNKMTGTCACAPGYTQNGDKCEMETVCTDGYTDIEIDGTKYSAYCIETIEQFRKIYSTGEGSETGHYILMDDFDLNEVSGGSTWQPMFKDGFKGIFYGNSKMLAGNLVCASDCALIQSLNGGKVYNLSLLVNISSKEKEVSLGAVAVSATDAVIKNVTSDGNVIGSGGTVGGLVSNASKTQIINSVIVNNKVEGELVGGLVAEATNVNIGGSYVYKAEISANGSVGGLVGQLSGAESRIIESYAAEANIMSANNPVGGLVGEMSGGRITTSYFYGELLGMGVVGGLVGSIKDLESNVPIEGCAVFGNLIGADATTSMGINGMIAAINDSVANYAVSIVTSMNAADISSAHVGTMLAILTKGNLNVNDVYTLGDFSDDVKVKWNDVWNRDGKLDEPKFYASWFTKGERSFKPAAITVKDKDLYFNEKLLIDVLTEISPNWKTYTCTIKTGPAAGSAKTYVLPLPKDMPVPEFCR